MRDIELDGFHPLHVNNLRKPFPILSSRDDAGSRACCTWMAQQWPVCAAFNGVRPVWSSLSPYSFGEAENCP